MTLKLHNLLIKRFSTRLNHSNSLSTFQLKSIKPDRTLYTVLKRLTDKLKFDHSLKLDGSKHRKQDKNAKSNLSQIIEYPDRF